MRPPSPGPGRRRGGPSQLRQGNLTAILRHVRDHGASSRHDIAAGCGLGVSTMTDLIAILRARRLVRELDAVRRPAAGRPTKPIALDGEPWCVLGVQVDLHAVSFVGSTVGGVELWRDEVAVPLEGTGPHRGFALLRDALCGQLGRVPSDRHLVAVVLGLPAAVSAGSGTVGSLTRRAAWPSPRELDWDGLPLRTLVYDALYAAGIEDVHVGVYSDSHLAGLHAVRREVAPRPEVALYLGGLRGVAGGVVLQGEVFRGADGGAGDLGHLHTGLTGPVCGPGRRGCLGAVAGPMRLLTEGGLLGRPEATELLSRDPQRALDLLVAAAREGDAELQEVLAGAGQALAGALDDAVGVLDPDTVVLGGFLGPLWPWLGPPVEERLAGRAGGVGGPQLVPLAAPLPRVLDGAVLAARDACFDDPLNLTHVC